MSALNDWSMGTKESEISWSIRTIELENCLHYEFLNVNTAEDFQISEVDCGILNLGML